MQTQGEPLLLKARHPCVSVHGMLLLQGLSDSAQVQEDYAGPQEYHIRGHVLRCQRGQRGKTTENRTLFFVYFCYLNIAIFLTLIFCLFSAPGGLCQRCKTMEPHRLPLQHLLSSQILSSAPYVYTNKAVNACLTSAVKKY